MKYLVFGLIGCVLFGGVFVAFYASESGAITYQSETETELTDISILGVSDTIITEIQPSLKVQEIEIQPGDTFSIIMEEVNVSGEEQASMLTAVQDVYDFTKLQAGKLMRVAFMQEVLASVDYDLHDDKKIVIENIDGEFIAKEEAIEYDVTETTKSVTIESSLFLDGGAVGLSDKTLVELAEIFQWDIDFATDVQVGDMFSLVYEKRITPEGEPVSPGKILAAKFSNQGETYEAYYFETSSSSSGYYDANGESVERQFLSSPIGVGYISSSFSYSRLNPVTKRVTPHRAIDYAAPYGTPIVAIADGEVTLLGDRGPLGIAIDIEHGQYMSQYAHMSRIAPAVKKNPEVKQGQIIGYVGSTGQSTGPHLHYALFKDGTAINPLEADLPVGESLSDETLDDFRDVVERHNNQLSQV